MKTYCFNCSRWEEYNIVTQMECLDFKGTEVFVEQKHAFCSNCKMEIFPDEIVDENTNNAHDAYRSAIGSITVAEMQAILRKYNTNPKPLSQLLGWGENTIERQMKHSIPDKEHADELKALMNPFNMADLLIKHGDRVSPVALAKLITATMEFIREITSSETITSEKKEIEYYKKDEQSAKTITVSTKEQSDVSSSSYKVSYGSSSQTSFSVMNPFDFPDAA